MRIHLALSVIIVSIQYGRCRIDLKRDKEVIVDIDSPELHQSQYHTADFDTSAYNYGYAVEPNGQFHHETRGGDGVTYGCYGYIDSDDLLKVTHYVADSQGYRTLEHEKPVLVYPIDENNVDEKPYKPKGVMLDWKDLYFPIGCGMAKGGVLLNAPVIRAPGGIFEQLGETKFPVQPSAEPKVVVPRIPFNSGIKTEPTKLIPISTVVSPDYKQSDSKTTASFVSTPYKGNNPSSESTQRPTSRPSLSTKFSNNDGNVNGPEYDTKVSYRQNQQSTIPPTRETTQRFTSRPSLSTQSQNIDGNVNGPEYDTKITYRQNQQSSNPPPTISSSSHPSGFRTSPSPFRESTTVNGPSSVRFGTSPPSFRESITVNGQSTVKAPSDKLILQKITSSPTGSSEDQGQSGYTEDLLPPFRTTLNFDYQTTVGVPIHSFDSGNDLNVINSYVNSIPRTTTQSGYVDEITTTVPTQNQPFSNNYDNNGPTTLSTSFKRPGFYSTERITTARPNRFDGFNFNSQTTTDGTPIDLVTESNSDSTNPDSTTVFTADTESLSTPIVGSNGPYTNQRQIDNSYRTSVQFSSNQQEPTRFGISSSIASRRPVVESDTTPNFVTEFETSTTQTTYPGIGDYSKPQSGFEFNIPTRGRNQASTPNSQSFVTISAFDTVKDDKTPKNSGDINDGENKDPAYDKTTKFTNGPHGAEYQLGSRIPHSQSPINNFNFLNPIKQSRKDTDGKNPPVSLITPLTHLTISGSFPSKNDLTASSVEPNQPENLVGNDPSTVKQSSIPNYSDKLPVSEQRESSRPSTQQSGFFTVTTPKNEPIRGLITHMNAISQTRFQSSRVTPSLTSTTPNDEQNSNDVNINQPADHFTSDVRQNNYPTSRPQLVGPSSTEFPFLYTRSRTTAATNIENGPYGESNPGFSSPDSIAPNDNVQSVFGQKIPSAANPATISFTAYHPESTVGPANGGVVSPATNDHNKPVPYDNLPYQPKFVLRPTARPNSNRQPLSNFNGYSDVENRNANFYPDSSPQKSSDNNRNNIQPESKYVNTKKEFIPTYNPNSTPIPGSLGTAIGVYPPNVDELVPEIPNFNIAISKWPFYILPFPFTNENIMTFPFFGGMPIQLGGSALPTTIFNTGTNVNSGNDYVQGASSVGVSGGNGAPAQTICSWLSSYIKSKENATTTSIEVPTNENGETLQISNLQVNIKNPQLQVQQNQIPFGIIGFIPIIAVPNCQHNTQGDSSALPTSVQIPSLCTQLSHLLGTQINTNQPLPTT